MQVNRLSVPNFGLRLRIKEALPEALQTLLNKAPDPAAVADHFIKQGLPSAKANAAAMAFFTQAGNAGSGININITPEALTTLCTTTTCTTTSSGD